MLDRFKKPLIIISLIIVVILMLVSFGGRDRVSFIESKLGGFFAPIQRFFSGVGAKIETSVEPLFNVFNYKRLNENLSNENQRLKEEIIQLIMSKKELTELSELKAALRFVETDRQSSVVSCNVIAKDSGNWFNVFVIDAGRAQGVTKNSTVITGKGLVGLVHEVGAHWSKVVAIIDQKSSVAFEMLQTDNDYDGMVTGTKYFELYGDFYDPNATASVGEYIVTSGLGIYPKGIMIGRIDEVIEDHDLLLKKVKINPVVNFRKLNKVMVIPYKENR